MTQLWIFCYCKISAAKNVRIQINFVNKNFDSSSSKSSSSSSWLIYTTNFNMFKFMALSLFVNKTLIFIWNTSKHLLKRLFCFFLALLIFLVLIQSAPSALKQNKTITLLLLRFYFFFSFKWEKKNYHTCFIKQVLNQKSISHRRDSHCVNIEHSCIAT